MQSRFDLPAESNKAPSAANGEEVLRLPSAHIARIAKSILSKDIRLTKSAALSLNRSAALFALYLSSAAHDVARKAPKARSTISSSDVLQALADLQFEGIATKLKSQKQDETQKMDSSIEQGETEFIQDENEDNYLDNTQSFAIEQNSSGNYRLGAPFTAAFGEISENLDSSPPVFQADKHYDISLTDDFTLDPSAAHSEENIAGDVEDYDDSLEALLETMNDYD